jgi:hypothetical protein
VKKHAVIGSRDWQDHQAVALYVNQRYAEWGNFILVSGGASGPSTTAEQTALEFGMPVISFRPVQLEARIDREPEYGVEEWRLHRGTGQVIRHEITFADFASAANYRSLLIAERAEDGMAFWDGISRGTGFEIEAFAIEGKVCEVYQR